MPCKNTAPCPNRAEYLGHIPLRGLLVYHLKFDPEGHSGCTKDDTIHDFENGYDFQAAFRAIYPKQIHTSAVQKLTTFMAKNKALFPMPIIATLTRRSPTAAFSGAADGIRHFLRWSLIMLYSSFAFTAGAEAYGAGASTHNQNSGLSRFVLDNGMKVILLAERTAPVVSIQFWVGTGSSHEDELLGAGLSHLIGT